MFRSKSHHDQASSTLVDVFMLFQHFAFAMIMIIASVEALIYFKNNVMVTSSKAFMQSVQKNLPLP